MQKKKAAKLGGFVGALCASGALVGMAVSGTGAYFTDSHTGTINTTTGTVKINTSSTTLDFNNLLPGQYKDQSVNYANSGSDNEDIWLVFPTTGAEAFTGTPTAGPTPLGRYGHFAVTSTNGAGFTSYNLARAPQGTDPSASCPVDGNGEGGSTAQAATKATLVPYCAPQNAILLASNVAPGAGGTATFTFGYTPLLKDPAAEGQTVAPLVNYSIVATQQGIRPDDVNNTGNSPN